MKQLLLVFIALITECNAQTFQNIYHYASIPEDYVVQQTFDGGYILLTSTTVFGAGNADIYLIKTNSTGDTLWTRTYGGTQNDYGYSICQTVDSGFIIAGNTMSFDSVEHGYLLKTTSAGSLIWSRIYGGAYTSEFRSVDITSDGGYITGGWTDDFGVSLSDFYVVKTDSTGSILWTKTYGGSLDDVANSIKEISNGQYIVAGHSNSFGAGAHDILLIKMNSIGNVTWVKTYGGAMEDLTPKISLCPDSGFIIAASTASYGAGMNDVLLIKTNQNGIVNWAKSYGGIGDDKGFSVEQTSNGGYVVAGYTSSFGLGLIDVYLINTDSNGDTLFTKAFGSPTIDNGYSAVQCNDGGYVVSGVTIGFGISGYGLYFIKTDSNGNSGCNETEAATIITSITLQVANPIPVVSSGGTDSVVTTVTSYGGQKTSLCLTTHADNIYKENQEEIFPNPFSDKLNFTIVNKEFSEIVLYDIASRKLLQKKFTNSISLNTEQLAKGLYLYEVRNKNGVIKKGKVVKN